MTLVEVLTVLAVTGMLVSILVPAVQRARESARVSQCRNNLRQIGLALHNYQTAWSTFPPGYLGPIPRDAPVAFYADRFSPHSRLLPYLDAEPIYQRIDFGNYPFPAQQPELYSSGQIPDVAVLLCPSDSGGQPGGCSYPMSMGPIPVASAVHQSSGAFPALDALSPSAFTDGLSNTIGFSEKLVGSRDGTSALRDAAVLPVASNSNPSFWVSTCSTISPPVSGWDADQGRTWLDSTHNYFNEIVPPNSPIPDCRPDGHSREFGLHSARSSHDGFVNGLMMDGATRSFSSTIDTQIWWAAGTRASGDAVSF